MRLYNYRISSACSVIVLGGGPTGSGNLIWSGKLSSLGIGARPPEDFSLDFFLPLSFPFSFLPPFLLDFFSDAFLGSSMKVTLRFSNWPSSGPGRGAGGSGGGGSGSWGGGVIGSDGGGGGWDGDWSEGERSSELTLPCTAVREPTGVGLFFTSRSLSRIGLKSCQQKTSWKNLQITYVSSFFNTCWQLLTEEKAIQGPIGESSNYSIM